MVCELDGPMPILKISKTLKLMRLDLRQPGGPMIRRRCGRGSQNPDTRVVECDDIIFCAGIGPKTEYSMIRYPRVLAAALAITLMLTATCASAASIPGNIAAAVADGSRPEADKARDVNRKPAETLAFTGVKPGMQIAELLPGGGYFTRLFSKAVGSRGHVYALVPAPLADAPADVPDFAARVKAIAADPNYSNVSVVVEPFSHLAVPARVDLGGPPENDHLLHNPPVLDGGIYNKVVF